MCLPKIRGGQRCHGHAAKSFHRAMEKLTQVETVSAAPPARRSVSEALFNAAADAHALGHRTAATDARDKAKTAGVQLASTPEGEREIAALAEQSQAAGRPEEAGWYDSMLREGKILRESNAAVKRAYARNERIQRDLRVAAGTKPLFTFRTAVREHDPEEPEYGFNDADDVSVDEEGHVTAHGRNTKTPAPYACVDEESFDVGFDDDVSDVPCPDCGRVPDGVGHMCERDGRRFYKAAPGEDAEETLRGDD